MPNNPYIAGNPVGKTQAFIGREDVLREVKKIINHPGQNAIALYGQRRIGKTSILQYLTLNLPKEGAYRPVYFDLQDKAAMTLANVLEELARSMAFACNFPMPNFGEQVENNFQTKWLPELLQSLKPDEKLVLLFDEFDILADPKGDQAAKAFFPYLRNLLELNLESLKFVFVLGRRIDDLDSIALSVFKGITAHRVSLLSREDTEFLARLSERNHTLAWSKDALSCLWDLTHGHPYLTQQLCSQVWDTLYTDDPGTLPEVTAKYIEDSAQKTLEASRNALEWIWNGLPPAERVVISGLAEAGPGIISQEKLEEILHNSGVRVLIRELRDAPTLLIEWDLIESDAKRTGYSFRVELLRRWLEINKPLHRVQEELDRLTPVADGLYQAAQGMFAQGNLSEAASLLRQAVAQNPNHLRANELLSEILITQNEWDEARTLLEHLYEINPSVARPRLAQVLIAQADEIQDESERLKMYDRILELEPRRYDNLREKADKIRSDMRARKLASDLNELERLQKEKDYLKAIDLVKRLAVDYPDQQNWDELQHRLEQLSRISELYQRALGALNSEDLPTAKNLFAEVVSLDPEYELASNYLNKAVRGLDALELRAQYDQAAQRNRNALFIILGGIIVILLISLGWIVTAWQYSKLEATSISMQSTVTALSTWAAIPIAEATQRELTENIIDSPLPDLKPLSFSLSVDTLPKGNFSKVAFSPDGSRLATGSSSGEVTLWNVSENGLSKVNTLKGHDDSVTCIAFSSDGSQLATGSTDRTLHLWDITDGKLSSNNTFLGHAGTIMSIAFSPDGKTLATGSYDKTARLWDVENGDAKPLKGHTNSILSIAFSPDGETLATGSSDGTVRLWNTSDGNYINTLGGDLSSFTSLAFSPNGSRLAGGATNGQLTLWSLPGGDVIYVQGGHKGGISSIAYSQDGSMLATGSYDKTVRLWSVIDGKVISPLDQTAGVINVVFLTDGRLAAALNNNTVNYWILQQK